MPAKLPPGIKIILFSHSTFWLATNLINPLLSVFFVNQLQGVTLTEVGIAALIYFLTFGMVEPIAGLMADKINGLKDEFTFVVLGYAARGLLFIGLAFATNVWHLYMFQFGFGLFRGLASPADKVIYASLMKAKHNAMLWGLDESLVNISAALGAGIGGYLTTLFGFRFMLVLVGFLTITAGIIFYPLASSLAKKSA